jgi:hypothetical protein
VVEFESRSVMRPITDLPLALCRHWRHLMYATSTDGKRIAKDFCVSGLIN